MAARRQFSEISRDDFGLKISKPSETSIYSICWDIKCILYHNDIVETERNYIFMNREV